MIQKGCDLPAINTYGGLQLLDTFWNANVNMLNNVEYLKKYRPVLVSCLSWLNELLPESC